MVVIAASLVTAIITNVILFDVPLSGLMNLWNLVALGLIGVMVAAKRRAIKGVITILYGDWMGTYLWVFVPASY